jgi:hypothetical protein
LLHTSLNGQPAALSYVLGPNADYVASCLTVLTLNEQGLVTETTVCNQLEAYGYAATLT